MNLIARIARAPLWRMTAVRLTLVYMGVLGVFAVAIVLYLATNAGDLLREQVHASIDEEVSELEEIFRRSNLSRLIRSVDRRARAPGANLYLIADAEGRIIAGNVRDIDAGILNQLGWTIQPFHYRRFGEADGPRPLAIARVFLLLPSRLKMLVGRDMTEVARFGELIRRTLWIAVVGVLLFGLLAWFLVGRQALSRIDSVARTSRRIMAGDLSQRLQLAGTGDEFDRLSQNLNALLDRIENLDAGLKQVSDNIAHDLRTPLARLRNKAEAARRKGPAGGGNDEALADIQREADDLISTFNALLMISRVEAGGRAARLEPLDLSAAVTDVHELFEAVVEEAGGTLAADIEPGLRAEGNRELLSQALSNLIENAVKYARPDGPLAVSLSLVRSGREAVIEVADNGAGVPEADRERVQQRFVRLDGSRSTEGSGLGLALVRAIAELHHGRLDLLDNTPGLRARMTVPLS